MRLPLSPKDPPDSKKRYTCGEYKFSTKWVKYHGGIPRVGCNPLLLKSKGAPGRGGILRLFAVHGNPAAHLHGACVLVPFSPVHGEATRAAEDPVAQVASPLLLRLYAALLGAVKAEIAEFVESFPTGVALEGGGCLSPEAERRRRL